MVLFEMYYISMSTFIKNDDFMKMIINEDEKLYKILCSMKDIPYTKPKLLTFHELSNEFSFIELKSAYEELLFKNEMKKREHELQKIKLEKAELKLTLNLIKGKKLKTYILTITSIDFGLRCESFHVMSLIFTNYSKCIEKAYYIADKRFKNNNMFTEFKENGIYIIQDTDYGPSFETKIEEKIIDFGNDFTNISSSMW